MLRDDINNAVKDAMRAKDERKLSTLRMVNSTIKNADIAARGEGKEPLNDADLMSLFQKMIKQRRDSIQQFQQGGRTDLADAEQFEISVLERYMPQALSEEEVDAAIAAAIAEVGAKAPADMGKVMGPLKAKLAGRADMGKVSARVKQKLAG